MGRTGRKSIWETPPGNIKATVEADQDWVGHVPAGVDPTDPLFATPKSVVEQLRVVEERKRDRSWEKQANNRPTTFRGVPPKLQAEVRQMAADLHVTVDDVARAFLEFGWQCYRKGELQITPTLNRQRLTLFPEPGNWAGVKRPGWFERVWETLPPKTIINRKDPRKIDEQAVKPWKWPKANYRCLPVELVTAIRQLHTKHTIPIGEIVTLFLGHALEAYRSGRLVLDPQPRIGTSVTFKEK